MARKKLYNIMINNITKDKIKQNDYILTEYNKYNYCFHEITTFKINNNIITNMLSDLNLNYTKITIKQYKEEIKTFIMYLEDECIDLIINEILKGVYNE